MMRYRSHHNNTGRRQIQNGKTVDRARRLAESLGVNFLEGQDHQKRQMIDKRPPQRVHGVAICIL